MNSVVSPRPTGIKAELIALGSHSERSILRHERLYLVSTLAIFTLLAIFHACVKPLSFDEFFTFFISRLTSLREMLRAMPADGQPPLNYLLTHVSLRILGGSEIALRVPGLGAYAISGFLTYRIVRTHDTAVQALFALALLLGSGLTMEQACNARPYSLLLCFTSAAFACWQTAANRREKRSLALCGLSLAIAAAILTHHYAVIYVGLFLGVGEVTRFVQFRRFDRWMALSITLGLCPLWVTLPMARESRRLLFNFTLHATKYGGRPMPSDLLLLLQMVALPLIFILAISTLISRAEDKALVHSEIPSAIPAHEWAAAAALILLFPVLMLVAAIGTGVVTARYVIGTSLGLSMVCAWGLPRLRFGQFHLIRRPAPALSTIIYVWIMVLTVSVEMMHRPIWKADLSSKAVSPLVRTAPSKLPIVVARLADFPANWWYSSPAQRQRIAYLSDLPYATHQADFLGELSLVEDQAYLPLHTTDYASFLASHPRFLLLCTGPASYNWVPPRLVHEGWHLRPIASHDKDVLYQVDRP